MHNATLSSELHTSSGAANAFDGKFPLRGWDSKICVHSGHASKQWWKVEFKKRVVIHHIHFYNRPPDNYSRRSSNMAIKALLIDNNKISVTTICAYTGEMADVLEKIFFCREPETLADELLFDENKDNAINFCEIIPYGHTL